MRTVQLNTDGCREDFPAEDWKWGLRHLNVAMEIASWSKDPSTKVGAVAVGAMHQQLVTGYNGLPSGIRDASSRMERPAKYLWTVHAEANLVAQAARHGISLVGSTVYCTHCSCAQCAALLLQAGVSGLVVDGAGVTHMGDETFAVGQEMFREANKTYVILQRAQPNGQ